MKSEGRGGTFGVAPRRNTTFDAVVAVVVDGGIAAVGKRPMVGIFKTETPF